MYDPKIARFLQEDTYTGKPDDPLSLNLYTYVKNNPLIYFDPTGHAEAMISLWIHEGYSAPVVQKKKEQKRSSNWFLNKVDEIWRVKQEMKRTHPKLSGVLDETESKVMDFWELSILSNPSNPLSLTLNNFKTNHDSAMLIAKLEESPENVLIEKMAPLVLILGLQHAPNTTCSVLNTMETMEFNQADDYRKARLVTSDAIDLISILFPALAEAKAADAVNKSATKSASYTNKVSTFVDDFIDLFKKGFRKSPQLDTGFGQVSDDLAGTFNRSNAKMQGKYDPNAAKRFWNAMDDAGVGGGSNVFKNGELFESKIVTKNGVEIGGLAEIEVNGKTLTLKDVSIYSNKGDIPNEVGARDIFQWQKEIGQMAKAEGFETLNIKGVRVAGSSSANKGKIVDYSIDLTKQK